MNKRKRNKLLPRIQLFISRYYNQRKTHKGASGGTVVRMAGSQSKYKKEPIDYEVSDNLTDGLKN